jgi:Flp pilus assembly protein protease CpaA
LPVQTALVTPENSSSYRRLWIIASLVCGFAVLIILLLRRSRTPHSSLITRSLDHDKKP